MSSDYSVILSSLRHERGLSQRKVAEDLGISQALLSHYENGVREPRFDFVVRACGYYGVSADYFLGMTAERSYEDKVLLPCPDPDMRRPISLAAAVLAMLADSGDGALCRAAARYLGVLTDGALRHLREPYGPADPAFEASVRLTEAEFLAAARGAEDGGRLPDMSPAAMRERYPELCRPCGGADEND